MIYLYTISFRKFNVFCACMVLVFLDIALCHEELFLFDIVLTWRMQHLSIVIYVGNTSHIVSSSSNCLSALSVLIQDVSYLLYKAFYWNYSYEIISELIIPIMLFLLQVQPGWFWLVRFWSFVYGVGTIFHEQF